MSDDGATIPPMAQAKAKGAARFSNRYTQAQKDALLKAVLIDGNTVKGAIRLAQAGELGVPAFTIGVYAYDIVKDGRDTFEANHEDALALAVATELKGAETDALATIRAIRRAFKRDGTGDVDHLARATKALSAIRRARLETQPRTKPKAGSVTESEAATSSRSPDVLGSLLNTASSGARKSGSLAHSPSSSAA